MLNQYAIYIRNNAGTFRDRLTDVTELSIVEAYNDVGSWSVKSTTAGTCPFRAGDGIVIYRNGAYYYSGVLTEVKETYDGYTGLYTWTASGQNELVYLARRIVYPNPASLNPNAGTYYTDSGTLGAVVKNLIDKNIGPDAVTERQLAFLDEVEIQDAGASVSVSLRFQTLLEAVRKLLTEQNFTLRAVWDADTKKLHYIVHDTADLSSLTVFSSALNQITETEYSLSAPQNFILSGGQGELSARAFASAQDDDSIAEWGRIEYFHDMRADSASEIQADADAYLRQAAEENVGWAAEVNADDINARYKRDWNIGDIVGVAMQDRTIIQRVLQVETSVSYDSETVKPTIGSIDRGTFDVIFSRLTRMRSDVNQLQWVSN